MRELGKWTRVKRATPEPRPCSVFPINQWPREILTEIFWNCVPKITETASWVSSSYYGPLSLCRVCSSWYALALATPKLWTTVVIIIGDRCVDLSDVTHVTNVWLQRSGALPLTLRLDHNLHLPNKAKPAVVDAILSIFYSYSSRWQNVALNLHEHRSMSFPRLDTPLLQSFHLGGYWSKRFHFPFSPSPRLKGISWPFALDARTNPQILWSQISYLHFSYRMSFFAASETIRLCPRLEEFSVMLTSHHSMSMATDGTLPLVTGPRRIRLYLQRRRYRIYRRVGCSAGVSEPANAVELQTQKVGAKRLYNQLFRSPGVLCT